MEPKLKHTLYWSSYVQWSEYMTSTEAAEKARKYINDVGANSDNFKLVKQVEVPLTHGIYITVPN